VDVLLRVERGRVVLRPVPVLQIQSVDGAVDLGTCIERLRDAVGGRRLHLRRDLIELDEPVGVHGRLIRWDDVQPGKGRQRTKLDRRHRLERRRRDRVDPVERCERVELDRRHRLERRGRERVDPVERCERVELDRRHRLERRRRDRVETLERRQRLEFDRGDRIERRRRDRLDPAIRRQRIEIDGRKVDVGIGLIGDHTHERLGVGLIGDQPVERLGVELVGDQPVEQLGVRLVGDQPVERLGVELGTLLGLESERIGETVREGERGLRVDGLGRRKQRWHVRVEHGLRQRVQPVERDRLRFEHVVGERIEDEQIVERAGARRFGCRRGRTGHRRRSGRDGWRDGRGTERRRGRHRRVVVDVEEHQVFAATRRLGARRLGGGGSGQRNARALGVLLDQPRISSSSGMRPATSASERMASSVRPSCCMREAYSRKLRVASPFMPLRAHTRPSVR
jgi:hypothetical protein